MKASTSFLLNKHHRDCNIVILTHMAILTVYNEPSQLTDSQKCNHLPTLQSEKHTVQISQISVHTKISHAHTDTHIHKV